MSTDLVRYGSGSGALGLDIDLSQVPPRKEVFAKLTEPVPNVHSGAKPVSPVLTGKVLENEPFEDYSRAVYGYRQVTDQGKRDAGKFVDAFRHITERFLRRTFYNLTPVTGLSFDVTKFSPAEERKILEGVKVKYKSAKMDGQIKSIENAYASFAALRGVFGGMGEQNLGLETVIPSRYLPELLLAAPVWFIEPKERPAKRQGGHRNPAVRYFSDLVGTEEFAYLFQLYNRTPRYFEEFEGTDIMPLPIVDIVTQLRNVFDFLVIATPYHDLASREWKAARQWTRNIDPFLFGFVRQAPDMMFFLGRWSGSGLFPLMSEMMADTIAHLEENEEHLSNFDRETPWYKGKTDQGTKLGWTPDGNGLREFSRQVRRNFDAGKLFGWLRGDPSAKAKK